MVTDPGNTTGWMDDFSYDEVVDYLARDIMSDIELPSVSGHIDAAPPEGGQPSNANEIDHTPNHGQGDYSMLK